MLGPRPATAGLGVIHILIIFVSGIIDIINNIYWNEPR
jgi:hypothetical protein